MKIGLVTVALAIALLAARVLWSSHHEWRTAEERFGAGAMAEAIDHWGRAARLYLPGNPWSQRALDRLVEQGAWQEVRSSLLAVRGLYQPGADRLRAANRAIAAAGTDAARLEHSEEPRLLGVLLALAGTGLMLLATAHFLWRALDSKACLRRGLALRSAVGLGFGLLLFVVGLSVA